MVVVILGSCRWGRGSWSWRRSGKEEWYWSLKAEGCGCGSKSKPFVKMMLTMINSGGALHPSILLPFFTIPLSSQEWREKRPRCQSYRISPSGNLGTLLRREESSPPRWRERCCAERPAIAAAAVGRAYCPPTALNPAKQVLKWLQQGTSSVSAFWWTK